MILIRLFSPALFNLFQSFANKIDIILHLLTSELKLAWLYCARTLAVLRLYCRAVGAISGADSSVSALGLDRLLSLS